MLLSKFVRNSFTLHFKVYWQLTIGEDTSETSPVLTNLFYWIEYDEIWDRCFMFKAI